MITQGAWGWRRTPPMNASFVAQVFLKHTVTPDLLQGKWQKKPSHDIKFMHECELAQGRNYKKTAKQQIHKIFFQLQLLPLLQHLNLGVLHCHSSTSFSLLLMPTVAFHSFHQELPKDNLPACHSEPTGNKWHVRETEFLEDTMSWRSYIKLATKTNGSG